MADVRYVKLKSVEDLIHAVVTAQAPLIHHIVYDDQHVYFVAFMPLTDASVIYYVMLDKPLPGKFAVYDKFNGSITFSDTLRGDTKRTFIPIIEVVEQNVFSMKGLVKKKKKKKGKEKR